MSVDAPKPDDMLLQASGITKSFPGGTFFAKVLLGRSVWARLVRDLGQKLSSGAGAKFFNRRTFLKHEQ